jgi:zinc protease
MVGMPTTRARATTLRLGPSPAGPAALAVLVAALALATLAGASAAPEPLPADPALVTGTLDNGLTYIVKQHGNPRHRIAFWLHVATGSLNETDDTRGIAHYLEHLAFNGSTNFPPGSVVPFFQSLGLSFGRDQNAFTGVDQTVYQLALPDTRPETIDKGLLFLSDVAFRLNLQRAEIDAERQIILEEMRARAGASQRVRDYVFERLAPESTVGHRMPIGTEATIRSVGPDDFRAFYRQWYVPANMTVIAVGDADPALVAAAIRGRFADGPPGPRPPARDAGVRATATTRAIVATDPELTRAEISIARVEPPRGPVTTVAKERADLVETLGTRAFNQRMRTLVAGGRVSFLEARASVREWGRAIRMISADASGRPADWRAMLADLGTELQRARRHGFSARELDDVVRAMIAEAEEAAARASTQPARSILRQISGAVGRGEPVMAAAQRLELLKRLLPGIAAREVTDAFAAAFDPATVLFVAELPAGGDAPDEAQMVALGRAAVDVEPGAPAETDRPATLLSALPAAGTVVEQSLHVDSGVTSAWLDNGVRVHHRFMDQRRAQVSVVVTVAGGRIQETAANRGISDAAAVAWDRPATSALSSPQIRDLMTGRKVRVSRHVGDDALTLTVAGDPADLESGLQLAYLLLTDPLLEAPALEQWKESQVQAVAARKLQPSGVLAEAMAAAFSLAPEPRLGLLDVAQVRAISLDAARAWLRDLVASAPIEVAIVGDLDATRALEMVRRYLGALPARARIDDKTLHALRAIPRTPGPIRVERTVDTRTPQAVVVDGFFGADLRNVRDSRLLTMAARMLSTRMNRTIREEKQLVYSIGASSQPASEYPGFGRFAAQAPTDPAKAGALAAAVDAIYAAFAADGPTPGEVDVARRQMATLLDEIMRDPEFWTWRLAVLDYRGLSLSDIVQMPAAYQAFTAAEIQETFARYYRPDARFRFLITPRPPDAVAPAPPSGS